MGGWNKRRGRRESGKSGNLPELPLDVWRVVWSQLSSTDLLRAAGVSNEWRRECSAKNRRDEAVALVTAPEGVPDSELSRPQQAWRGIQRILRLQNPFSGKPFSLYRPNALCPHGHHFANDETGVDRFCLCTEISSVHAHYSFRIEEKTGKDHRDTTMDFFVGSDWKVPSNGPVPDSVEICLYPSSTEHCRWMQGLLLALTGGFRGLLRAGLVSDMPESLSLCNHLAIRWECPCPESERLWPLQPEPSASDLMPIRAVIWSGRWFQDYHASR